MTGRLDPPRFSVHEAEALARRHFAVIGTATALPSYIDCNFRIDAGDDGPWVLKIANARTEQAELEFESVALKTLSAAALELRTPTLRNTQGRELHEIQDSAGVPHLARMVTFVEGTLLSDAGPPTDTLLRDFGAGLAQLDRALAPLQHPAQHRALSWDLARASWIADALDAIRDPKQRAWVEHALLQYRARIVPRLEHLPRGIVHNDANDYNVVVERGRVCGLFDFGDMVHTCRMFEPVIAATYAAFHRADDPLEAIAQLAAGYHQVEPFAPLELDLFADAVRTRLAVSVVSSAKTTAAAPEHTYASVSETSAWRLLQTLCELDPTALRDRLRELCGLAPIAVSGRSPCAIRHARQRHLSPSLSLSYATPLRLVRGHMQYLFDAQDRAHLDAVNNVCHVGHCHPNVVRALATQAAQLNTNTRYLDDAVIEYAERLVATLPEHLEVCMFVCTGSEANELALRMARAATSRHNVMVLDHAYHGNTSSLVELSPYKFNGRGGAGCPEHVQVVAAPDPYRGAADCEGSAFAERTVGETLERARSQGRPTAVLFAESLLGCGGQIVPPPGYLARAFDLVRAAGGVAVADEVQVGFGRVGSHMWAFEAQGATPDIVTMGKPIGNGHPMAAVVTTRAIAERFANGMEYFNTFGGNPVSSRVGLAVLDAIEHDGLRRQAQVVGDKLQAGLTALSHKHPLIGDVRGMGMFIGVELVHDRKAKTPAGTAATQVVQHCRAQGILLATDGPLHNVLKIKPPLPFDEVDARLLLGAVDRALASVEHS